MTPVLPHIGTPKPVAVHVHHRAVLLWIPGSAHALSFRTFSEVSA
jgi:hypothetical protein